ncbi:MAG TPA: plasmid partition protein ParG [Oculatellaceae cyanobacterium]
METLSFVAVAPCQNADMGKETMHVVIPSDLKKQFKAACVMEGVNMSDVVVELLKDWMEKRKGKAIEGVESDRT